MSRAKKTHMNIEMREIIEEGLRKGDSARTIAKRLSVSPSTITREVKTNRTVKRKKAGMRVPIAKQSLPIARSAGQGCAIRSATALS